MIRFGAMVLACFCAFSPALMFAQSARGVAGPAEAPPPGFSGQQYVDSNGCVFMRAGFGGQVNWVPRIGRDRKPMCSEVTAAQAAARLAAGDAAAAVPALEAATPQAQNVGAPLQTVASDMSAGRKTGVFAPMAVPGLDDMGAGSGRAQRMAMAQNTLVQNPPAQQRSAAQVGSAGAPLGRVGGSAAAGCPANAPVLQTLPVASGGTVAVCTRGDGTATGWVSPAYASVGGALRGAAQQAHDGAGHGAGNGATAAGNLGQMAMANGAVSGQQGGQTQYKAAWTDDRLNPLRGLGTQTGWSQQAQVWTQKVPAQTHADVAQQQAARSAGAGAATDAVLGGTQSAKMTASSMSAGGQTGARAGGQIYVQVGTFGISANVQNAAGRLAGLGLPVASARSKRGGTQVVSVMAGPFASAAQAQQALGMARNAGFADAFIR